MTVRFKPPVIPAAFFGIVLGLAGLGGAWRAAHQVWQTPAIVGEALMALAAIVWLLVSFLFILKWIYAWEEALDEAQDPVQCCYIGLAGVATMLIAAAALGYSRLVAEVLFGIGALFTLAFAAWRTGALWYGEREQSTNTPVLYLPAVAGGFVTATVASALGYPEWGQLAFGVGLFSWLAIESVLLHRLYTATSLTAPLRPTLGIQLAPPAVGAVAYLSVNGGNPDLIAHALIGYALMQLLIMLRFVTLDNAAIVRRVILGLHFRHHFACYRSAPHDWPREFRCDLSPRSPSLRRRKRNGRHHRAGDPAPHRSGPSASKRRNDCVSAGTQYWTQGPGKTSLTSLMIRQSNLQCSINGVINGVALNRLWRKRSGSKQASYAASEIDRCTDPTPGIPVHMHLRSSRLASPARHFGVRPGSPGDAGMGRKSRLFAYSISSPDSQFADLGVEIAESLRPCPRIFPFCGDYRRRLVRSRWR